MLMAQWIHHLLKDLVSFSSIKGAYNFHSWLSPNGYYNLSLLGIYPVWLITLWLNKLKIPLRVSDTCNFILFFPSFLCFHNWTLSFLCINIFLKIFGWKIQTIVCDSLKSNVLIFCLYCCYTISFLRTKLLLNFDF